MRFKRIITYIIVCIFFLMQNYSYATQLEAEINSNEQIVEDDEMKIYSEAAILIEEKSGKVLYDKEMNARKYPASLTKILTAIIAIEKCNLNEKAVASSIAVNSIKSGYSTANIQVGEEFTISDLLDVMMIHSANEAANIIAEHISGSISEFAKLMNQKAKEIGCLDSNFVNPNGMHNENHYSTAYDLALIARYCMKNETFRKIVVKESCALPTTEIWQEERIFKNTNNLLNPGNRYYYFGCNGIKTGFTTPAKNCLITSCNRDGFEIISVILHAESTDEGLSARYTDTIKLLDYGYNNYKLEDILEEYDLIEYSKEENQNSVSSGIVTYTKNDNMLYKELVKIFLGIVIIFIVIIFYVIRNIKKKSKPELYNFKLN